MFFLFGSILFLCIHINFSILTASNLHFFLLHLQKHANIPLFICFTLFMTGWLSYLSSKSQHQCIHNLIYITIGYSVNIVQLPNNIYKSCSILFTVCALLLMYALIQNIENTKNMTNNPDLDNKQGLEQMDQTLPTEKP